MFRISVSESYELEDCWYYNATTYSTTGATLNVNLPNSAFTVEYDSKPTTRNSSAPYVTIGRNDDDKILIGQFARAGGNGLLLYTGTITTISLPNNSTLNAINHYTFTYDGSNYIIDRDGENTTITAVGIHLDNVLQVGSGAGGELKNIKVKPL